MLRLLHKVHFSSKRHKIKRKLAICTRNRAKDIIKHQNMTLFFWFCGLLHILGDGTGQRGDGQAVFGGGELVVLKVFVNLHNIE